MTIGELARKLGLSRSTLLYYDKRGLLRPSGRSEAGHYRNYGPAEWERARRILAYRDLGLSLAGIARVLDGRGSLAALLEQRLLALGEEIAGLRAQQRLVLAALGSPALGTENRCLDKERWVEILAAAGLDETGRARWHREFERLAPGAHQDFLEALGLPGPEITAIRSEAAAPLTDEETA